MFTIAVKISGEVQTQCYKMMAMGKPLLKSGINLPCNHNKISGWRQPGISNWARVINFQDCGITPFKQFICYLYSVRNIICLLIFFPQNTIQANNLKLEWKWFLRAALQQSRECECPSEQSRECECPVSHKQLLIHFQQPFIHMVS